MPQSDWAIKILDSDWVKIYCLNLFKNISKRKWHDSVNNSKIKGRNSIALDKLIDKYDLDIP